jgi:hypothetical protein
MTLIIETVDDAQEKALIAVLDGLHIPYTQRQTVNEYNHEFRKGRCCN